VNSSPDAQENITDTKEPLPARYQSYRQTLLHYIIDVGARLHTRPETDLPDLLSIIDQLPNIPHATLYLKQNRQFYRVSHSTAHKGILDLSSDPVPDTLMAQLQPYQHHSGYACILPVTTIQDEIPALLHSLEASDTRRSLQQSGQQFLLIPLISQTIPLGFLVLPHTPSFADDIIDLLILFGQQLTALLERAQFQDELRHTQEGRKALFEIGRALMNPEALWDLQTVYRTIYTQLSALMPIDFFTVERYDPQQQKLIRDFEVEQGKIQAIAQDESLPPLFLNFLWEDQPLFLMFSSLNEFRRSLNQLTPAMLDYVEKNLPLPSGKMPQSGIAIVIKYAEEPVGIFSVLSYQEQSYTHQHLSTLIEISGEAAVAIRNAAMYNKLSQALKAAQESEKMKDHFLMTASHELRTPLTAVQGYLELLDTFGRTLSEETKRQFLSNARRATEELGLLVGNLMDASRIDQDKVEMKLCTVHLIDSVHTIIEIMNPTLISEARPVEIQVPDTLYVVADDLRLRQILLNLVGNAIKYSPEPQGVAIYAETLTCDEIALHFPSAQQKSSCSPEQQYAVIAVRDWGPGITPEDQPRLFNKFIRLNSAINSTQRGAGLGLYLCRQLSEAMQGFIWMESSGISGEGCTFFVALPLSKPIP
jgi:signal transduction histidine kinase